MDAVPQEELLSWTSSADGGIIPYQPMDLDNYYCSPNKLFEFIQAELPVIGNDLPFLRQIIEGNQFGVVHRLESVADYVDAINRLFADEGLEAYKQNLRKRKNEFSWEREVVKLLAIYSRIADKRLDRPSTSDS